MFSCHPERSPAEIPLGYASCFWGKPQKFDKLKMTPDGVRRDAVEIRATRGSNDACIVWDLIKTIRFL